MASSGDENSLTAVDFSFRSVVVFTYLCVYVCGVCVCVWCVCFAMHHGQSKRLDLLICCLFLNKWFGTFSWKKATNLMFLHAHEWQTFRKWEKILIKISTIWRLFAKRQVFSLRDVPRSGTSFILKETSPSNDFLVRVQTFFISSCYQSNLFSPLVNTFIAIFAQ